MVHQLNIVILAVGAIQGWLLSLVFFRNSNKLSNRILTAIFVTISLQLTSKVISKAWLWDNAYYFYNISYFFPYLIGPLVYLYFRSRKHGVFRTDVIHFLPFALTAVWTIVLIMTNFRFGHLHPYTHATLQIISLMIYSRLALKLATGKEKTFIRILAAAEAIIIVTLALMVMYYGRFPDV